MKYHDPYFCAGLGVDNCTVVRCHENWFNLDHDAMNGCEAQCPEVPNGTLIED